MGGLSSSVVSLRAGGGSPSERPARSNIPAVRRDLRLRRRKDFDKVFRAGRAWSNNLLVLRTLASDLPDNRFGFITSKRVGNAIVRNRTRRRLREALRRMKLETSWDIVVSAKTTAAKADYYELKRAVVDLLVRAGILKDDAGEQTA